MIACPNPTKARYATRAAAENAATRATYRIEAPLRPYECVCTWWHLTKNQPEPAPRADDAAYLDLERLLSIPDIDFREIVAADARGEGDPGSRAGLRHRRILPRWRKMLGQLIADVNGQLSERSGDKSLEAHDWRKRAVGYRDSLMLRISECRRLRSEAHLELMARHDQRRAEAERAAASGASVKELRRHAGEIAIDRLIKEHRAEFDGYLAEEYEALGLQLPDRVAKWVRQRADPGAATGPTPPPDVCTCARCGGNPTNTTHQEGAVA